MLVGMHELFEVLFGGPAARWGPTHSGLIRASGEDRVRFLNGMLSNDVAALEPGQACTALQLDRRGHVLAQLEVLARPESLWLELTGGSLETVLELLRKHVIADDVLLEPLEGFAELAIEGPGAVDAARSLGVPCPAIGSFEIEDELVWLGGGRWTPSGLRVIGPESGLEARLAGTDLPRIQADAAEILRIEAGRATLGVDTGEKTFPQEAQLEHAVSYSKGCYIGQEIVARIHSRGAVNRLLVRLALGAEVAAGTELRSEGRITGRITSTAVSPSSGAIGLGYVKREDAEPGSRLDAGGVVATIR